MAEIIAVTGTHAKIAILPIINNTAKIDFIKTRRKNRIILIILSFMIVFIFAISLICGRYNVPLRDIFKIFIGQEQ